MKTVIGITKEAAMEIAGTCLMSTAFGSAADLKLNLLQLADALRQESIQDPEAFDRVYGTKSQAPTLSAPTL